MKNKKLFAVSLLSVLVALVLAACGNGGGESTDTSSESAETTAETEAGSGAVYKVGVVGDIEREVWEDVAARAGENGVELEVEVFTDYVQPNNALADGSLDLNAFQHMAHLKDFADANGAEVEPIAYTYISPMAAYSDSLTSLDELEEGATVAIPNDVTNGGRALLLLELAGVIEVDDAAGISPSVSDITANPKNIVIEEVEPAQVPRSIADVDVAIANTNYAVDAGLDPYEDGIFVDTDDLSQVGAQYKNAIAVRSEDVDNPDFQIIVEAYQSPETEAKIEEVSNGADESAWSENDDVKADYEALQ